jgi:uncharacterized phage protein gp47/JayE
VGDYGLKTTGFIPKPLSVIKSEVETGMQGIFGANLNLDAESPDGQQVGLLIGPIAELWETIAEIATMIDPLGAGGVIQSKQVRLNGITRRAESYTTISGVRVIGANGVTLPAGSKAETAISGDVFILQSSVLFDGSTTQFVSSWVAEQPGPISVPIGELSVITTPVAGWSSVDNTSSIGVPGAFEETDGDLRRRREQSTETSATSQIIALEQSIANMADATDALVLENPSTVTDPLGLPAHSFLVVAEGGVADTIAGHIWDNKPIGILDHGADVGNATDVNGNVHVMHFERPVYVPIFVSIVLVKTLDYPAGGDDLMKLALIEFAAGSLTDAQGDLIFDGFKIGVDVQFSRLYQALHTIPGHTVTSLNIDTTALPATGTANISISNLQKSQWTTANIGIA